MYIRFLAVYKSGDNNRTLTLTLQPLCWLYLRCRFCWGFLLSALDFFLFHFHSEVRNANRQAPRSVHLESHLTRLSYLGTGLLLGTALGVIIPE